MSHCDLCGVSLGSDPEAYRCGELMTCVRHLQDNLQQEWSSNKNNVANYQLQVEELSTRLAAAEDALQALYDYQNGCPLPTYRVGWTAAMVMAENVLRDADERLEKQIAAKEVRHD